jgi:signal transduction histidine kinase
VNKYEAVKRGVEEVKNGNLTYKIKADGEGELDRLARGINEISEASNIAIQNELKNQRLKTDLISNVSHDLKTPLTSIITYIDLLKQEGLDSADAPKYLEILDQKSIRLKKLTEDLFDAAKASSGAIPVKFEKVEMLSLINQGLGEMSDRIETSDLEFKVNAQKEKYYVRADGQLLWRVVENLLGNVLKYAQEGSRVYIDLREQNGKNGGNANVILEIKNISKTELNIDADELMERFKRGDESRTTEGSGLGLAIAKDLVRLQNGWFEIKIDGDLFKAVVMLDSYTEE